MKNQNENKQNKIMNKYLENIYEDNRFSSNTRMSLTSTPIKVKDRKSISLLDISDIPCLQKTKINASSETLGSTFSNCKDSGYNQSSSSLISDTIKPDGFEKSSLIEYSRLLDELKYKETMIASLYESNHNLRMKLAEAENKITELRFKCESHCRCCPSRNQEDPMEPKSPDKLSSQLKYRLSTFAKSEPCVLIATQPVRGEPSTLPCDDAFSKVQQWQNSVENLKEWHKKLTNAVTNPVMSRKCTKQSKTYVRPAPEPLPKTMSYMETSRALAETYRRRQEKSLDLFNVQVIGDHSVSLASVKLGPNGLPADFDPIVKKMDASSHVCRTEESPKEACNLPGRPEILNNLLIRNQTRTSRLLECLRETSECAAPLTAGLSQLSGELDEIRSMSIRMS